MLSDQEMVFFFVEQSCDNDINVLLTRKHLYPGSGTIVQISNMKASAIGFASIATKLDYIETNSIQQMVRHTLRITLGNPIKYIRMVLLLRIGIRPPHLLLPLHSTLF